MNNKTFTACIALILLAGCKIDEKFLVQSEASPLMVTRSAYEICTNNVPATLHGEISAWMIQNQNKWTFDLNTYVPETVVENDFIQINIQKSRLILSIKQEDGWPQYSRPIKPIHLKWKTEIEKISEQGGPGYPPQGVGSPDP